MRRPLYQNLTAQVLTAIALGVLLGALAPDVGKAMKPVGDTFVIAIGLVVVNVTKPGAGIDASALAKGDISKYAAAGKEMSFVDFITHVVPSSVVGAFAAGDVLQVVF